MGGGIQGDTTVNNTDKKRILVEDGMVIKALGSYEENIARINNAELTPEQRERNLNLLNCIHEQKKQAS